MTETAATLRRLLETESPQTATALVGKLRCTKRHLRRLVEELKAAGVPVEKGRNGREQNQKRYLLLLVFLVITVGALTVYFGEKSANLGIQIFTNVTIAIVSGLGGFGIGRTWNDETS